MTYIEWIAVSVPILLALSNVFADKIPRLKGPLDGFLIGTIFSLLFSLYVERFPELKASSGMMYSISKDHPIYSTFERLVPVSNKIERIPDKTIREIFVTQLRCEMSNLNNVVQQLSQDRVIISKHDADSFGTTSFESAMSSVDATSYVAQDSWWVNANGMLSRGGRDYIMTNADAVKRGVKVRRIFIFDSEAEKESMKAVLEENKNAGVEVLTVYSNRIEGAAKADLILVDKKLAGELTLDPDTRKFERFEATYSSDLVENIAKRINSIIRRSEPY